MQINVGKDILNSWLNVDNIYDDVVMKTQIEILRNTPKYKFVNRMTARQKEDLSQSVISIFNKSDNKNLDIDSYWKMDFSRLGIFHSLDLLLPNSNLKDGDFFTDIIYDKNDLSTSCILNCKDHFIFKSMASGLNLEEPYGKAKQLETIVSENIEYAKNEQFGYLTANAANSGTGLKITIILFIPCIIMSGELDSVREYLLELNCGIVRKRASKEEENLFHIYMDW